MKGQSERDESRCGVCGVQRSKQREKVSVRLKREELEGANERVEESLAVCRASRYTPKSTEHREAQDNRIRRPERDRKRGSIRHIKACAKAHKWAKCKRFAGTQSQQTALGGDVPSFCASVSATVNGDQD